MRSSVWQRREEAGTVACSVLLLLHPEAKEKPPDFTPVFDLFCVASNELWTYRLEVFFLITKTALCLRSSSRASVSAMVTSSDQLRTPLSCLEILLIITMVIGSYVWHACYKYALNFRQHETWQVNDVKTFCRALDLIVGIRAADETIWRRVRRSSCAIVNVVKRFRNTAKLRKLWLSLRDITWRKPVRLSGPYFCHRYTLFRYL